MATTERYTIRETGKKSDMVLTAAMIGGAIDSGKDSRLARALNALGNLDQINDIAGAQLPSSRVSIGMIASVFQSADGAGPEGMNALVDAVNQSSNYRAVVNVGEDGAVVSISIVMIGKNGEIIRSGATGWVKIHGDIEPAENRGGTEE